MKQFDVFKTSVSSLVKTQNIKIKKTIQKQNLNLRHFK